MNKGKQVRKLQTLCATKLTKHTKSLLNHTWLTHVKGITHLKVYHHVANRMKVHRGRQFAVKCCLVIKC